MLNWKGPWRGAWAHRKKEMSRSLLYAGDSPRKSLPACPSMCFMRDTAFHHRGYHYSLLWSYWCFLITRSNFELILCLSIEASKAFSQLFECSLSSLVDRGNASEQSLSPFNFHFERCNFPHSSTLWFYSASERKVKPELSSSSLLHRATLKYGSPWKSRSREASAVKHQALLSKKRIKKPWTKKSPSAFFFRHA